MKRAKTIKSDIKKPYCIKMRPSMLRLLNQTSANTGISKSLIIENGTQKELNSLNGIDFDSRRE
jgi:hypothetical protein